MMQCAIGMNDGCDCKKSKTLFINKIKKSTRSEIKFRYVFVPTF